MRLVHASCLLALAVAAASPAVAAGEPNVDSARLRRLLVQELLAVESAPAAARSAGPETGTAKDEPATAASLSSEVGRSVAAVPTWPVFGLCLVLGAMLWWLKRGRPARPGQVDIRRLASVPLGGKRSLALVEVMGERLLLGLADKQVNLLARMAPEADTSPATAVAAEQETAGEEFFERELQRLVESRGRQDLAATAGVPAAAEQLELDNKLAGLWSR